MTTTSNEYTPFGKLLAAIGFIAGLSLGFQISENPLFAFGCGIAVAVGGTFVGDFLWRLVLVLLSVVLALGMWHLRSQVARAAFQELQPPTSIEREVALNDPQEGDSPGSFRSMPSEILGSPRLSEPFSRVQPERLKKHQAPLEDRTEDGIPLTPHPSETPSAPGRFDGYLFKSAADADIYADPEQQKIYIFHGPWIDHESLDHAEYYAASQSLVFVDKNGHRFLFPAKIGNQMQRYFAKDWFQDLNVVQTRDRKIITGTVLPIVKH